MYHSSKFALEAFSVTLRGELYTLGIDVVTVNPSFHSTNIVSGLAETVWRSCMGMPPDKKRLYSEGTKQWRASSSDRKLVIRPISFLTLLDQQLFKVSMGTRYCCNHRFIR